MPESLDPFIPAALTFYSVHVRGPTDWTFFELAGADGSVGLAEISSGAATDAAVAVVVQLAGRLRGERLADEADIVPKLGLSADDMEADRALATAVSGLRCAVADAQARRAGVPLVRFLGGTRASSVELYANINRSMLPDDDGPVDRRPAAFAAQARRARQDGFATLKCAPFDECRSPFAGPGIPREALTGLDRVAAVREAIAPEARLFVDCHGRFDLDSALALEPELRRLEVAWYEEPVHSTEEREALRRVREASEIPVAGAETAYGLGAFEAFVADGVLDIVMPDVKHCGGPGEAAAIGRALEARCPGSVSMHCPSGPVSLLASAPATAAFRPKLPLEHAVYEADWRADVLEPAERVEGGALVLPGGPGLGARLNERLVARRGRKWTV